MRIDIASLKESNEFLNILFDNITSAIFISDKEIKIQSFNDSFRSLFYKDEDLIIGQYCGNALGCIYTIEQNADCGFTTNCDSCSLRSSLIDTFLKKVPVDRAIISRDFYIKGKTIQKHFQFSTRNISWNQQEMILVIVDDITESEEQKKILAKKNEHLEELNKQKNELLGIAAHDLRNPLSVICSFSEIMYDTFNSRKSENLKEMLQIIKKTGHYSLQLLNDILDYSKIESGTLELKKLKLNYQSFVKENIAQNELLSVKKNIAINLHAQQKDLIFEFDPRRMDQVLNNLIGNAIKYSYPGKDINIYISREDDYVVTSVEDQGQGIPETDLPHIFKPFVQMSVRPTENEKSTGLGLAIVKKIIDFHKGIVTINSTPGSGSVFKFYLPL